MPRITWAGPVPGDGADFEGVLREFAITLCPPRAQARLRDDGLVEVHLETRPGPGAVSSGNRSREERAYQARVAGTFTLLVSCAQDLRKALDDHYGISTR